MIFKLVFTVAVGTIFPARGIYLQICSILTTIAIALLFFMHGVRLSREKIVTASSHWKLHLWVVFSTFVLFPILGLLLVWKHPLNMAIEIYTGFLYLCILPATVQSSIALTSIAGGNIAAAICSSSVSSLIGIFLSPFLAREIMGIHGNILTNSFNEIGKIFLQLLFPFVIGHLSRYWIGGIIQRNSRFMNNIDQFSILLMVYSVFSAAAMHGTWTRVNFNTILLVFAGCFLLLLIALAVNFFAARLLFGFERPEEIVALFCGSKKSLVNGVPMANILFPVNIVGVIVLPLMIFHQVQLIVCAIIAYCYKFSDQFQKGIDDRK